MSKVFMERIVGLLDYDKYIIYIYAEITII